MAIGGWWLTWWRQQMETFSAELAICAGNSPVPTQRPVTRSFDVFFDLRLNKRLSKQSWGWWYEKPSRSLWRQCNECLIYAMAETADACIIHLMFIWYDECGFDGMKLYTKGPTQWIFDIIRRVRGIIHTSRPRRQKDVTRFMSPNSDLWFQSMWDGYIVIYWLLGCMFISSVKLWLRSVCQRTTSNIRKLQQLPV